MNGLSLNLAHRCNNRVTLGTDYYGCMKAITTSVSILLLAVPAMDAAAQSAPACRVAEEAVDQRAGNAGCLIAMDGKTLLIEHLLGGKLGFPGGTALQDEMAQCTAHRETWEETGLDVEVGPFLRRLSTGFLLYACTSDRRRLSSAAAPPVADWSRNEVSGLLWRDLDDVPESQWRFPDQIDEVAGLDDP